MKVFQRLQVSGPRETLEGLIATMEAGAPAGWRRDREAEASLGQTSTPMYCFAAQAAPGRAASTLWLVLEPQGRLYMSNIVPRAKSQLSYDECNAVLADFLQTVVRPAAGTIPVEVTLTAAEEDLEAWASPNAARLLRIFARSANKATGTAHPHDRMQWHAFLVAAHKDRIALDPSTLARWLQESAQWPDDTASDVATEYETGRALLQYYDGGGTRTLA